METAVWGGLEIHLPGGRDDVSQAGSPRSRRGRTNQFCNAKGHFFYTLLDGTSLPYWVCGSVFHCLNEVSQYGCFVKKISLFSMQF